MDNDYPCSHSMDTCFFAIDKDGHVAYFETGEAGAVPANALSGEEAYFLRQELAALPLVEVVHDRRSFVAPGGQNKFIEHCGRFTMRYPTFMFLASLDPVADEIAAGRAVQVPASEGVAVMFQQMPEEVATRLHD